jgi:hypothetical protein
VYSKGAAVHGRRVTINLIDREAIGFLVESWWRQTIGSLEQFRMRADDAWFAKELSFHIG